MSDKDHIIKGLRETVDDLTRRAEKLVKQLQDSQTRALHAEEDVASLRHKIQEGEETLASLCTSYNNRSDELDRYKVTLGRALYTLEDYAMCGPSSDGKKPELCTLCRGLDGQHKPDCLFGSEFVQSSVAQWQKIIEVVEAIKPLAIYWDAADTANLRPMSDKEQVVVEALARLEGIGND